jgi:NAD-dependent DNA ligase
MPTAAFKKSLYVFLCSLLGMLILLTLQHAIIFLYLSVITAFGTNDSINIDLYSLNVVVWFLSVFFGGWWGVWLGMGWYKMVYEDAQHKGFVHGLATALYGFSQGGKKAVSTPVITKPKWSLSDIIPKIQQVIPQLRTGAEVPVQLPVVCPVCGAVVERRAGEVALVCTNRRCYAMEKERIVHAARAFAIDGLGEKIVERLMEVGLITQAPDIFSLTVGGLAPLDGFGEVSAKKLVEEIARRRNIALADFIVALGIRHVGAETAFTLSVTYGSLDHFLQATEDELQQAPDIGPTVAGEVAAYVASEHGKAEVAAYLERGVEVIDAPKIARTLQGKKFVITGTLAKLGREEAKDRVRLMGGGVADSVSKKTDFVVVGENPGSKAEKARELGVAILSEDEFLRMVSG